MKRSAVYLAGFLLLSWTSLARAQDWAVDATDAGASDFDADLDVDPDLDLEELGAGGSAGPGSGPSKGPSKGPSSGPSKGAGCSCHAAGGAATPGLAGAGLLLGLGLARRAGRRRA